MSGEPAPLGPDHVRRLEAILQRHPHVTYLGPRESGDGRHMAVWQQPSPDPRRDGAVVRVSHEHLRDLVDELMAILGPGAAS